MCHAGDELADGGQPFAMDELITQAQLFGRVAFDPDVVRDRSARIPESDHGARCRKRAPVTPAADQCAAPDTVIAHGRHDLAIHGPKPGFDEISERELRKFITRVTKRPDERIIRVLDDAILASDENELARLLRR